MNFASLQQKKELYNQKKGSIDSITLIETKVVLEDGISVGGKKNCVKYMRSSITKKRIAMLRNVLQKRKNLTNILSKICMPY